MFFLYNVRLVGQSLLFSILLSPPVSKMYNMYVYTTLDWNMCCKLSMFFSACLFIYDVIYKIHHTYIFLTYNISSTLITFLFVVSFIFSSGARFYQENESLEKFLFFLATLLFLFATSLLLSWWNGNNYKL